MLYVLFYISIGFICFFISPLFIMGTENNFTYKEALLSIGDDPFESIVILLFASIIFWPFMILCWLALLPDTIMYHTKHTSSKRYIEEVEQKYRAIMEKEGDF